jgi:hypothetical protein
VDDDRVGAGLHGLLVHGDRARELAVGLIAAYKGALLLINTFRDPDLILREGGRLEGWIDSLV